MITENNIFIFRRLVQMLIKKGKKAKAFNFFLTTVARLKKNTLKITPFNIIAKSIINFKPLLTTQKFRKSSRIFNLPKYINDQQRFKLSLRWYIKSVNARKEKTIQQRMEKEFIDSFHGKGLTLLKKRSTYNMILVNRPVLHLLAYR